MMILTTFLSSSLQSFVKNAGPFAQNLVDKFLDALTDGNHSKVLRRQEQVFYLLFKFDIRGGISSHFIMVMFSLYYLCLAVPQCY